MRTLRVETTIVNGVTVHAEEMEYLYMKKMTSKKTSMHPELKKLIDQMYDDPYNLDLFFEYSKREKLTLRENDNNNRMWALR